MSASSRFLRCFFRHFYHGFAWTYDYVAAAVSLGRWNDWILSVLPYIEGRRVLEIGHGPGHLQLRLRRQHAGFVAGLDESMQMGRMARRRLLRGGYQHVNLVRGLGQALPFGAGSFDAVVSTFPTEYIYKAETLREVRRILAPGGRFIVVPAAWIVGRETLDQAAAWLFRVTDQVPRFPAAVLIERLRGGLEEAGFRAEFEMVATRASEVLIVIADR